MKKLNRRHPPIDWKKGQTRPCPTGKCKHRHVAGTGPCIESGCGCHGAHGKKRERDA